MNPIATLSKNCSSQKKFHYLNLVPLGEGVTWKLCIFKIRLLQYATKQFLKAGAV